MAQTKELRRRASIVPLVLVGLALAVPRPAWSATVACTTWGTAHVTDFVGSHFDITHVDDSYWKFFESSDHGLRVDLRDETGCCWGAATVPTSIGVLALGRIYRLDHGGALLVETGGSWAPWSPSSDPGGPAIDVEIDGYTVRHGDSGVQADAFAVRLSQAENSMGVVVTVDSSQVGSGAVCNHDLTSSRLTYPDTVVAGYRPANLAVSLESATPLAVATTPQPIAVAVLANLEGADAYDVPVEITPVQGAGALTWTCAAEGGASCAGFDAGGATPTVDIPVGGSVRLEAAGVVSTAFEDVLVRVAASHPWDTDPTNDAAELSLIGRWRLDADGDGWGLDASFAVLQPAQVLATDLSRGGDCDDSDATTHPGAALTCDGVDRDCDGDVNGAQLDLDGDSLGGLCDSCPLDPLNDTDGDGVCWASDNCPLASNPDQADGDHDGIGDVCDPCALDPYNDADGDGICGGSPIAIQPVVLDLGDVELGASAVGRITVSNLAPVTLRIDVIAFSGGHAGFSVTSGPALPLDIAAYPSGSVDAEVTFTPEVEGLAGATLVVSAFDPARPMIRATVPVTLTANGEQQTPSQLLAGLLDLFDASVRDGALVGSGPGNSATGRLGALRNMLKATGDLVNRSQYSAACRQLADALLKVDGGPVPPDFATGPATDAVQAGIASLRTTLACM